METRRQGDKETRRGKWLFRFLLVSLSPCLLVCSSGCRNQELLENELRARDFQYLEMLDDFKKTECANEALRRENDALRQGSNISPEQAAQTFGVTQIALGMGTMGVDTGKIPGDSALQVVVQPRDADDHVVRTSGTLQVTAQQISPEGIKSELGTWNIDAEQLRRSWSQNFIRTGYVLVLPWTNWPQFENLRVTVRLILPDDRVFEADRDIKVRLVPPGLKLPCSDAAPPVVDGLPGTTTTRRVPFTPLSSSWQPAPLTGAIRLGRAEPVDAGNKE